MSLVSLITSLCPSHSSCSLLSTHSLSLQPALGASLPSPAHWGHSSSAHSCSFLVPETHLTGPHSFLHSTYTGYMTCTRQC